MIGPPPRAVEKGLRAKGMLNAKSASAGTHPARMLLLDAQQATLGSVRIALY